MFRYNYNKFGAKKHKHYMVLYKNISFNDILVFNIHMNDI